MRFCLTLLLTQHNFATFAYKVAFRRNKIPTQEFIEDAEKKHARVAMLALPTLIALSTIDPEPTSWLARQPIDVQLSVFSYAGILEAAFTFPRLGPMFSLKPDAIPGNIPPFPLPPDTKLGDAADTLEDLTGRACMIMTACILASHEFLGAPFVI